MYSSSRHHKKCRSRIREANGATFSARKQRREKEKQITSLQATIQSLNELLRKLRELNTSINRSCQAAEGKVVELEAKLKDTERKDLDMRIINHKIERSLKLASDKLAVLENKLKESELLLEQTKRTNEHDRLRKVATLAIALNRKDKVINQRNQEIEELRKMLSARARVLPSYVQVHDVNEKLQKEREKHAQTSQSLQHMTSRFHTLEQELQVLANTKQEMEAKNIEHVNELEKQLSSRDKQIADLERNKEFQYRDRKKQYEEIVSLKRRIEELDTSFPARKRRRG